MTKGTVKKQKKTMTDDRCDSKKQKKPSCVRAHIRTQERFLLFICHICHLSPPNEQGTVTEGTVENKEKSPAYVCAYVRRKVFLLILLLLLLLLPDKENRCTHFHKQVHPFPKTGAPISQNRCTRFGEPTCPLNYKL